MGSIGVFQLILLAIIFSPVIPAIGAAISPRYRRTWLIALAVTAAMSFGLIGFGFYLSSLVIP